MYETPIMRYEIPADWISIEEESFVTRFVTPQSVTMSHLSSFDQIIKIFKIFGQIIFLICQ